MRKSKQEHLNSLPVLLDDFNRWERNLVLQRNELLKLPGTTDTRFFFIVSGSVRVCFEDEGKEHIIRLGYKGDFIGALDSFISEMPSDLSITALRRTHLKPILKKNLIAFFNQNENTKGLWESILMDMVYQQIEREKDLLVASPQKRYERVLNRSPHLFQEIPLKYIAEYLRMTPETLSRLRNS